MADTVTTSTIHDGDKHTVIRFTNESDGSGEAAVQKVNISALRGAPGRVSIETIWFSTRGMGVDILWDATTDVLAETLPADDWGKLDYTEFAAVKNNAGAGITGDIMFTTRGAAAGDAYTVTLKLRKHTT